MSTRKKRAQGLDTPPPPPSLGMPKRGVRLRSSENIRAELARVYRAYRAGAIDAAVARTSGFLLQTLAAVIRDDKLAEIEAQLEALRAEGLLK